MKIESSNYSTRIIHPIKHRNLTFKRNIAEHMSWGANYIAKTGKADFKLFSFPTAQKVFLEVAKNVSATIGGISSRSKEIVSTITGITGATFALSQDENSNLYEMNKNQDGIFNINDITISKDGKYRFVILDKNGNYHFAKDPYSKKQTDINGWSEIYNSTYEWKNKNWFDSDNPNRIKRDQYDTRFHGLAKLVIEEINIPTLSEKGDFESAKRYVDGIAERGIANAIEIMPLENTYSLQWGYDGVDKFAVNSKMGGNDKFKEFVDYAHGKGLNVIIDMVPNHMGPDGDYLNITGPYEECGGIFGSKFNYEGENNKYVRDYMVNAALNWINEYKADGLRLDLTTECNSDLLLKQIAKEINYHNPEVFIIAEHGANGSGITRYSDEINHYSHEELITKIDKEVSSITDKTWLPHEINVGFDSKWDFEWMHSLTACLFNNNCYLDNLENAYKNSAFNIRYLYSHDEIGNLDGTRLVPKILAQTLNLAQKANGYNYVETAQTAARISQAINDVYVQKGSNLTEEELNDVAHKAGLRDSEKIKFDDFITAYNIAKAKQKLALGAIFTTPGPKMFFQGDDRFHTEPFKFFREFSNDKILRQHNWYIRSIINEKGYDTLESIARKDCITNDNLATPEIKDITQYTKDLSSCFQNMLSLNHGKIIGTYKDRINNVFISHLKYNDEETLVFMKFGNGFHKNTYFYNCFPDGKWKEIINSDNSIYRGGGYTNTDREIFRENQNLSLAPYSICILKKIN